MIVFESFTLRDKEGKPKTVFYGKKAQFFFDRSVSEENTTFVTFKDEDGGPVSGYSFTAGSIYSDGYGVFIPIYPGDRLVEDLFSRRVAAKMAKS